MRFVQVSCVFGDYVWQRWRNAFGGLCFQGLGGTFIKLIVGSFNPIWYLELEVYVTPCDFKVLQGRQWSTNREPNSLKDGWVQSEIFQGAKLLLVTWPASAASQNWKSPVCLEMCVWMLMSSITTCVAIFYSCRLRHGVVEKQTERERWRV